jgi:cysteine desulfurase / selenocysteine lyase
MDKNNYRNNFPLLTTNTKKGLVYLDSAATSLKPQSVINAVNRYYTEYSANIHRGLYPIAERATEEYEQARGKVAKFIRANRAEEVIFTRGTTESINLFAYAWGRMNISDGDEIVTTISEHHSNFVPWQVLAQETGAQLKVINFDDDVFSIEYSVFSKEVITKRTKLVAISHVSNVLGNVNPIKEIVREVKRINPDCLVLVDGAQAVPHMKVDVQDLGCDFYAFSGHKMLGPTGIGVLWGKYELLDKMPPFLFGGSMIEKVTLSETTYKKPPHKFEAGTPPIAEAIGLGAAVSCLEQIGMDAIARHETELTGYLLKKLENLNYLSLYGLDTKSSRVGVVSFNLFTKNKKLIHPHDVVQILGDMNICVRGGHHCTMPLHTRLGIPGSVRASLYLYNSKEDIERLVEGVEKVRKVFS